MNWTNKITHRAIRALRSGLFAILGATVTVSEAALLSLSDTPLFLTTAVEPNVLLTYDDSGSMAWGFLPDIVGYDVDGANVGDDTTMDGRSNRRASCSSVWNKAYYNPNTTYLPPLKADGTPLNANAANSDAEGNSTFGAAFTDGHHAGTNYTYTFYGPPADVTVTTPSPTVNLAGDYQVTWNNFANGWGPQVAACGTGTTAGQAAFYYRYNTSAACPANPTTAPLDACFTLVQHGAGAGAWTATEQRNFANWYSYYRTRDMAAKTAAGRAFALLANNVRVAGQHLNEPSTPATGTGIRFTNVATDILMRRFCNDPSNTDPLCANGSTDRDKFFTRLYNSKPRTGGTPLRQAMQRAGQHFELGPTATNNPYLDTPGDTSTSERSCRQNYHILMTDGYWNGDAGVTGNIDGTSQTFGDSTTYTAPRSPYSDNWSDTLADNAFYYWYRDLRTETNMPNNVSKRCRTINTTPTSTQGPCDPVNNYWDPRNDPANWQHLVTYTIGFGIDGTLPETTLTYNSSITWPDPTLATAASTGERLDDLWHAAINSRGQYFKATNPESLTNAFTSIINSISEQTSSSSAVALNSGALTSTTFVYQSRFNPRDWSGQLLAYGISASTGELNANPTWDAGNELNKASSGEFNARMVITYKPSTGAGIPFRWSNLDTVQQTELNKHPLTLAPDALGSSRLNYLRGDASNEGTAPSNFRPRKRNCGSAVAPSDCPASTNTGVLGDIINSAPVYVGKPPFNYPDTLEAPVPTTAQKYSEFKTANSGRDPIIYVGANDGMLHGFNANTGVEKLAYVPSTVYRNLSRLTGSPYTHTSFVDGSPVVSDVFINGAWRTILVSGLRGGGPRNLGNQGVFALDITNPSNFIENNVNADAISLWEFNDSHSADLGNVYGDPVIAKMNNGKWAVIVPGGYNNDQADGNQGDGSAALYILFIEDGADGTWSAGDFIKIDTGVGSTSPAVANGLASPAAVDVNGDYKVDYIYAGDLRGNMWRFDVSSATETTWDNATKRKVIFEAKIGAGASAVVQPITSRPQVAPHPAGYAGNIVYFGTGKYIETSDAAAAASAPTQTFYAFWDDYTSANTSGIATPTRANLLEQTVTGTTTSNGAEYRAISNNNMVWRVDSSSPSGSDIGWYIDLPTNGELVAADPLLLDNRIIFTTIVPSNDPCVSAGYGWLMELNATNGGRLASSPFDVNGDGVFSDADFIPSTGGSGAAGGKRFDGIPSGPAVLIGGSPAATPTCTGPKCKEQKLISTTADPTKQASEQKLIRGQENNPTECYFCRSSWRQIR